MADSVRPDVASVQATLMRSHALWSSYAYSDFRIPIDLQSLLGKVPAFPGTSSQVKEQSPTLKYHHSSSTLRISGSSSWETSLGECKLPSKTLHHDLPCGFSDSAACYFVDSCQSVDWILSQEDGKAASGSHTTLLILAWAYILSGRWVELQRPRSRLAYSPPRAEWQEAIPTGETEIDVGEVSEQSIRWWAALLAPGQGWRAEIDFGAKVFQSPWSVSIASSHRLTIRDRGTRQVVCCGHEVPPSSEEALIYLRQYCELHAIDDQCTAALAVALFFPWKNSESDSIVLPVPSSPLISSAVPEEPSHRATTIQSHYQQLPYFMTLSCNVRGLRALLSGSFFEPDIPCNLVGPYLQPVFEIIDPLIARNDLRDLATIMGRRQPTLACLWLGAIAMGLETSVFQSVRSGLFSIEPHAAAWTGTIHSFIDDVSRHTNATPRDEITRADECQLLYLTASEGHQRHPVSPWPPFGFIPLNQTEIEVRQHAYCKGHNLRYSSWCWDTDNESGYEDLGFDPMITPAYPRSTAHSYADMTRTYKPRDSSPNELASEVATRSIFGWLRVDGVPSVEKSIFTHSWFIHTDSSSEESLCDDDEDTPTKLSDVEAWLDNLEESISN